ncbi:unnamed protein product [Spodoptera littoralis]|uniref:Uncharacterized protein n=1 Tax=Spodoptera littoralis TaxID=7109 RepID=A0A9P0I4N3_SPOLI|nr:unnamed protein product [Spodoptera littoralis]CAH1639707.1 unnamed protein product [Spodoptera littoralis]
MSASASPCEERARSPRAGASPSSAPRSPAPAHAVLATMTPVQPAHDYYPHKVEMDSDDGYPPEAHSYRHSPHELAAYATDSKVPVQPDVYDQGMESMDEKTPIDLIYEDEKQTVIYTTTPDQKRVEMISGQLDDGQLVSSGGQLVDGGVSVVVGAPGQPTVLVLADHVVDELGQVITIPSVEFSSVTVVRVRSGACGRSDALTLNLPREPRPRRAPAPPSHTADHDTPHRDAAISPIAIVSTLTSHYNDDTS